jgi:hypothetical protein
MKKKRRLSLKERDRTSISTGIPDLNKSEMIP